MQSTNLNTPDLQPMQRLADLCGLQLDETQISAITQRMHRLEPFFGSDDLAAYVLLGEFGDAWRKAFAIALREHWPEDQTTDIELARIAGMMWSGFSENSIDVLGHPWPLPEDAANDVALHSPIFRKANGEASEGWYLHGKLHREGGPALICRAPEGWMHEYYRHGELHRVGGPAVEFETDDRQLTMHYRNGVLHREDGPAVEDWGSDRVATEYWQDGKRHRESSEGPARVLRAEEKIIIEYWEHGHPHRDPEQGPAVFNVDGGRITHEYFVRGVTHRDSKDGPAMTRSWWDYENIEYREHGELHRAHTEGPAEVSVFLDGSRHEAFYANGQSHRPSSLGPASKTTGAKGEITYASYSENDQLHRDPMTGPAFYVAGGLNAELGHIDGSRSYWWHGTELSCPLQNLATDAQHG